jgi:hypothetical protein
MKKLRIAAFLAVITALVMATGVFAIFFNNGNFESGSWTPGWDADGQREFLLFTGGYDGTGFPNLAAGGSDLSTIIPAGGAPALSIADPNTKTATNSTGVLMYPAVGNYSARVNSQESWSGGAGGGHGQNANTLYQSSEVGLGDVDGIDGKVHLRLLYAAVMVEPNPAHTFDQMPMFFLEVKDETTNTIILHKQSYVGELGIPWQTGLPVGTGGTGGATDGIWKFLDWSYVDIIAGESTGPNSIIGHTLSVKIVATGCSPTGHPGYVYVDELGSSNVGVPAVVATGPATRNSGQTITYTYTYFNGASSAIDATITVTPPVGVTFTSTNPACTVNGLGVYSCYFPGVPANSNGSFNISGTVTALGGSTINHGDYNIAAAGFPTLTGPVVITNVPEVPVNTPPVITEGDTVSVTMSEDNAPTPFALTLHATDADGDPLTWSKLTNPTFGIASITPATGVVSYKPFSNYYGPDTFNVQVADGFGGTDTITVNVTVTPVDDPTMEVNAFWNIYNNWRYKEELPKAGYMGDGYITSQGGRFTMDIPAGATKITFTSENGPDQGNAQFLVDGVSVRKVSLYNATVVRNYLIVVNIPAGGKKLTVVALGTKNAASTGTWVRLDAYQFNNGVKTDATLDLSGWKKFSRAGSADYRQATRIGDVYSLTFIGQVMVWETYRGPDAGKVEVYVDGVLIRTIDLYKPNPSWHQMYTIGPYPYGRHTYKFVIVAKNPLSTGSIVIVDSIDKE